MKSTIHSYFLVMPPFFCNLYGPLYDAVFHLPATEWQTKILFSCNSNFIIATLRLPQEESLSWLKIETLAGMAFLMHDIIAWHIHSLTEVQEETIWTRSETEPMSFSAVWLDCLFLYSWICILLIYSLCWAKMPKTENIAVWGHCGLSQFFYWKRRKTCCLFYWIYILMHDKNPTSTKDSCRETEQKYAAGTHHMTFSPSG